MAETQPQLQPALLRFVGDDFPVLQHAADSASFALHTAMTNDMNGRNMEPTSSAIGLIVIVALYVTIGVMSAAGSVYIAKSIFSAKVEQIFFGLFLIPIAGFYLAFTAYFGDKDAWRLEATAVAVFALFSLVGVRGCICSHSRIPATWPMGRGPRVQRSCWRLSIGPSPNHIGPTSLRLPLRHI
jgi:hypothetical protein